MAHADAFECNLTIVETQINVASKDLCGYTNYHIYMLALFGTLSFISTLSTCLIVSCGDDPGTITAAKRLSLIFFITSMGFEIWPVICIFMLAAVFLGRKTQSTGRVQVSPLREIVINTVSNTPITDEIQTDTTLTVLQQVVYQGEIEINDTTPLSESGYECPICLSNENNESNSWTLTCCGHTFHTICLGKCRQDLCPLCRVPRGSSDQAIGFAV
jgi:hypothetical protein